MLDMRPKSYRNGPDQYCGGLIVGNSNGVRYTMSPGTYVMAGGGFQVTSSANLAGSGVTVYNTTSSGWGCSNSYSYTPITINGQSSLTLSAPGTGPLAGVVLFGDRTACSTRGACQNTINGQATAVISGALYFKNDQLIFNGGSSSSGCLVVAADTVTINGNSTFDSSGCSNSPVSVSINPTVSTLYSGQTQQFTATVSNTTNQAVTWSISPSGVGTISSSGLYTAPATVTAQQTVTVTAMSQANPAFSASATVTLKPTIKVTVTPATATLYQGQTQQFTATVTNTSNTAVTWSISPSGVGTISSSGLYTAPASIAMQQTVTVTATSVADGTKSAQAQVALMPLAVVSVTPASLTLYQGQTQQFAATVANASNTAVTWSISPASAGTITSSGFYSAPFSVTAQMPLTVTATSQADPTKSASAPVRVIPTVLAPILTLAATTPSPYVTGTSQKFTVVLTNEAGTPIPGAAVTITVSGANSNIGSSVTDSNGGAAYSYSGVNSGADIIQAIANVSGAQVTSNAVAVSWIAPAHPISTGPVTGQFFASDESGVFDTSASATPVFSQTFPNMNFNPPAGMATAQMQVTVSGYSVPWRPIGSNIAFSTSGMNTGLNPTSIPVIPDEIVNVTYVSGLWSVSSPVGSSLGYSGNWWGSWDANGVPNSSGPSLPSANADSLVGGFADAQGQIIGQGPLFIGDTFTATAPIGATQLLMGINDGTQWSDNSGAVVMNVSLTTSSNNTNTTGVTVNTHPFTDVTTDYLGNSTGTVVAEGNGVQAGAVGQLYAFQAVFTGTFTVSAAGDVPIDVFANAGFILGLGDGATPVSGPSTNAPTNGLTPFTGLPVMGAFNAPQEQDNVVVVHFPAAGTYHYELDYACSGAAGGSVNPATNDLSLVLRYGQTMAAGSSVFNVVPAITGTLAISPSAPSALGVGQSQTLTITALDENGNPVPNLPVALVLSGVNEPQMAGAPHVVTTDVSGVATYSYTGINTGNDTLQAVTTIGGLLVTSNTVVVPWTSAPATAGTGGSGTLSISVSAPNTVTLPNSLSLSGTVSDGALASGDTISTTWSVASGPGSVSFANPQQATTTATFSVPGNYVLQLAASDAINSGAVQFPVTVNPAPPTEQGWIGSPANGSTVSGVVTITLATGVTLQNGTLTYYPANNVNNVTTLNPNTIGSGQIGTLDTTTLVNGSYWIQLQATDTAGELEYSLVFVTVAGNNKPGRVTATVTDLVVPANGLAINIQRTYDSLNAGTSSDFGYGWSLGTNVNLTVDPPGNVTFTLGGIRRTFFLTPQFGGFFLPYYTPAFTPEPGLHGTLTDSGPGCADFFDLLLPDGSIWFCVGGGLYNPPGYIYTDPSGTSYTISASGALQSIRDRNGNTLTITVNGITSTTGQAVTFTRDPNHQNRITQIEDQNSNIYQYAYDSNGNLDRVTYPTSTTQPTVPATFSYLPGTHLYQSGTDSRGNPLPLITYYEAADFDANNLPLNGRMKSVTDALSETTGYTYDLVKNSTTVTYPPDGNGIVGTATMVYDSFGMLLNSKDPLGNLTTNSYDNNHNLASVTTPSPTGSGFVTTYYTYDSNGNRKSAQYPETAANKNTKSYTAYNQFSEPTSTTDEMSNVRTFNYDVNFSPQSVTDVINGQTAVLMSSVYNTDGTMQSGAIGYDISVDPSKATVFTYDAYGNVASRTDALGRTTSYTYDALGHKLTMVEPLLLGATAQQATTTYTYGSLGNLTNTAAPLGRTTSSQYDGNGNKSSDTFCQSASKCHTTSYTYDALNRLTETVYPDSTSKTVTYDFRNNVIDETVYDSHSNLVTDTHYGYDLAGRRTSMTTGYGTAAATTTNYAYHADGHLQTETDGLGHSTNYTYDEAGNMLSMSGVKGNFLYGYDAARNRTSMTDGNNHTTYYSYDARKRLTQTQYFDSTTVQNGYDGPGNLASVTDQAQNQVQYNYDAANQLQSVVQPASPFSAPQNTTAYGFDALGDLRSVEDANQHTTQYTYDLLGELTSIALPFTPPLAGNETRTYDQAGNMTALQHFNGQTTSYTYDGLNRLLSRSYPGEPTVSFTYTPTGKRQTMTDASGTTTYSYDGADRLQKKATPEGTLDYTYDAAGHLASMSSENANGVSVSYAYDNLNRLQTVTDIRLTGQNQTTYNYDAASNLYTVSYPNGVQSTFTYDTLNRVTDLDMQGSSQPGNYHYDLSPTGLRKDASEPSGRSVTWSFDGIYRLTNEQVSADPANVNGSVGYNLDPVGNRQSAHSSLTGVSSGSSTYDADDRLSTETYDANGNVTSVGGGRTFAYDSENHLVSMNNGAVTIVYDCDGNRVAKAVTTNGATVTTRYLVDDLNPTGYAQVVDEVVNGAVQREYTYGLQRIGQNQVISGTWTPSFYGYDGFGSVRQLTNSAGVVTDTYTYDAFGVTLERTGTTPNVYMYRGEQYDPDLGLYYLRARYYNSLTGRFLSRDPLGGKAVVPRTLHKYLYAGGDPVNQIDPSGRGALFEFALVAAFVVQQYVPAIEEILIQICAELDTVDLAVKDLLLFKSVFTGELPDSPQWYDTLHDQAETWCNSYAP
jgi:RHS repeat-associated protein